MASNTLLSLSYLTSGAVLVTFLLLWQNAMTRITYIKKMFNWVQSFRESMMVEQ